MLICWQDGKNLQLGRRCEGPSQHSLRVNSIAVILVCRKKKPIASEIQILWLLWYITIESTMMDLQAKLIVGFVWCIITFEGTCYLYLFCPLLYEYVNPPSLRTSQSLSSSSRSSSPSSPYFASATTNQSIARLAIPHTTS